MHASEEYVHTRSLRQEQRTLSNECFVIAMASQRYSLSPTDKGIQLLKLTKEDDSLEFTKTFNSHSLSKMSL
jgi:hypothetical protein